MENTKTAAAKAIRAELKANFPGIKFSVRSPYFGKVNIDWTNGPTRKAVEEVVGKYEYGSFNGMEDIYEYNNRNDSLPQVKFVFCHRDVDPEIEQKIRSEFSEYFSDWGTIGGYEQDRRVHDKINQMSL